MKKLKSIYQYFSDYTKEQIDAVIEMLTKEEKALLYIRYGNDLEHPVNRKMTKEETGKFYGGLIPKIRRMLMAKYNGKQIASKTKSKITDKTIKEKGIKTNNNTTPAKKETTISKSLIDAEKDVPLPRTTIPTSKEDVIPRTTTPLVKEMATINAVTNKTAISKNPVEIEKQIVEPKTSTENQITITTDAIEYETMAPTINQNIVENNITKNEYQRILELLRTPSFMEMMNTLSVKEAIIISLKLGYVDGKYFSTESIAKFLEIEEEEVIETTKKILQLYKDSFNSFIDKAIEVVANPIQKIK